MSSVAPSASSAPSASFAPSAVGRQQLLAALRDAPSPIARYALQCVLAASDCPDFDTGLAQARSIYDAVLVSDEAVALQRAFSAGPPKA